MAKEFIIEVKSPRKPTEPSSTKDTNEGTDIGNFTVKIDGKNIIFEPKDSLSHNREVVINISDDLTSLEGDKLEKSFSMWYTTTYWPVYTTPTMIRLTESLGVFLEGIPDDTIWRTILKNSNYAHTYWGTKKRGSNIYGTQVLTNKRGQVPWCVTEFVTYATVLDLLGYVWFTLAKAGGMKKLADLTIDNRAPNYSNMPIRDWWRDIAEKLKEARYQVELKCTPISPIASIRGINYWEPIPIVEPDKTWKRWPKYDNVSSFWKGMYPAAASARLDTPYDGYHVGAYPTSTNIYKGKIVQDDKYRK